MKVRYFVRHQQAFRKRGSLEERFDSQSNTWLNVRPAIGDWLFGLDTDTDEVDESVARSTVPAAFGATGPD